MLEDSISEKYDPYIRVRVAAQCRSQALVPWFGVAYSSANNCFIGGVGDLISGRYSKSQGMRWVWMANISQMWSNRGIVYGHRNLGQRTQTPLNMTNVNCPVCDSWRRLIRIVAFPSPQLGPVRRVDGNNSTVGRNVYDTFR